MLRESRSRRSALVLVASLLGATASSAFAGTDLPGQPYASYWFPSTILDWDPATDPDAPFNRGSVSARGALLEPRFQRESARASQTKAACRRSSRSRRRRSIRRRVRRRSITTRVNYWQYIDQLVFWGGSAGEGLILAPNPTVIDAAHERRAGARQRVSAADRVRRADPVGARFRAARCERRLPGRRQDDRGRAVLRFRRLVHQSGNRRRRCAARDRHAGDARIFPRALEPADHVVRLDDVDRRDQLPERARCAEPDVFPGRRRRSSRTTSSSTSTGPRRGFTNSATLATSLGRSPYELYAGIDVESNGYNTGVQLERRVSGRLAARDIDRLLPAGVDVQLVGELERFLRARQQVLGRPERRSEQHDDDVELERRRELHSGELADHDGAVGHELQHGPGSLLRARRPGRLRDDDWNNLSLQDVLPTWRWIVRSDGTPLDGVDRLRAMRTGAARRCSSPARSMRSTTCCFTKRISTSPATPSCEIAYQARKCGLGANSGRIRIRRRADDVRIRRLAEHVADGLDGRRHRARRRRCRPHAGRDIGARHQQRRGGALPDAYRPDGGRPATIPVFPEPPQDVTVIEMHEIDAHTATLRLDVAGLAEPGRVLQHLSPPRGRHRHVARRDAEHGLFRRQPLRDGNEATSQIDVVPIGADFVFNDNGASTRRCGTISSRTASTARRSS